MTTAKWILCLIAASVISSYVTFQINQPNQKESDAAPIVENSSLSINATKQRQNLAEIKTTTDIAQDSNEINLKKNPTLSTETDIDNSNQTQPPKIEDLQFAYEKKQNEIASFREFTEKNGDGVLSVITKNYDSEPVDSEWARSKEEELLALMDTNKTLQNAAPLELSCKSQNCRLVLSVHDENQSQLLYSAFKDGALQGSDENKKQVISYFNNPERGEIHIYLSKSTVRELIDGKMN